MGKDDYVGNIVSDRRRSLFYEILAGVWVRNGLQIKGQAMTYIQANFCNSMVDIDIYWLQGQAMKYIQANFCNSMVDIDIYWLQVCAAHLPADQFMDMCIDLFGVREWLSMAPMSASAAAEQDSLVEGLLTFLAILVSSRTNLSNDELTQSRLEVATLLAGGDKTHSQLLELMPERSGNAHTRNFEHVLKELSTYRPPPKGSENLEQGLFVPRPVVWEQYYEPLHVLRRAVHRRDFHASMERFTAYVREKQKSESGDQPRPTTEQPLWPPLRAAPAPPDPAPDPRVLAASGVLHGALLAVLHRGVHRRSADCPPPHCPPDHVLALALYLLQTAADLAAASPSRDVCIATGEGGSRSPCVSGRPLLKAFPGASVCDNARTYVASVPRVVAPPPTHHYPAHYHSDSDTEWEPSESDSGRTAPPAGSLPATSTALAVPQSLEMARTQDDSEMDSQSDAGGDAPRIRRALEFGPEEAHMDSLALALQDEGMDTDDGGRPTPQIQYDVSDISPTWSVSLRERRTSEPASEQPATPPPQMSIEQSPEQSEDQSIPVNESIISLLLKLHSQLSGRLDSFSLDDEPPPTDNEHIGDGTHFTGRLLRRLGGLDARCAAAIQRARRSLWPHVREKQHEQQARERREKEERTRRARERQQQLMAEFALRQRQFMSAMELSQDMEREMAWQEPTTDDCVICNRAAPDPLARVVLLQSTSVLGHRRLADSPRSLALSEAELPGLQQATETTLAAHHYRQHDHLQQHFAQESWVLSVSVGWEGGVHATSCGHVLHVRCLHAYLRTLAQPPRRALHVAGGEFLCPVCRQLANSVLPVSPAPPRPPPRAAPPSPAQLQAEILHMLEIEPPPLTPCRLSEAMGKAMEDMTATAGIKIRQRYGVTPAAIFTFVTSLARTNLECELVQRGGDLVMRPNPRYKPRNDCIVPLMVVVGTHARVIRSAGAELGAAAAWRALCPAPSPPAPPAAPAAPEQSLAPAPQPEARPVPLLLKDPVALLMHFVLLAPEHPPYIEPEHFNCIIQALYDLTYHQIVCQFIASTSAEGRAALAGGASTAGAPTGGALRQAARVLLGALAGSDLFTEDGAPHMLSGEHQHHLDIASMESELQQLLLPFLRISALLRHHLYNVPLPDILTPSQEYPLLMQYCGVRGGGGGAPARAWARELAHAANRGQLVWDCVRTRL
ncbi:hypothetical protein JYU34_006202 [Plutella xylostella]|uniref:E3 ubiquitin-protein ligase n=1 Tax=Plutella xylostella TaxID=51655 RepID=A0ABQ7QV97_PLUXY|nr:hypothetical protein JYU34_006202 [Plutella xylostella]